MRFGVNAAIGVPFTKILLVKVLVPQALVSVSVTVYSLSSPVGSASKVTEPGFAKLEVLPLPKFQLKEAPINEVEVFTKLTFSGPQPELADEVNDAVLSARVLKGCDFSSVIHPKLLVVTNFMITLVLVVFMV